MHPIGADMDDPTPSSPRLPDEPPYPYAGPEALRGPIEHALRRVVAPEVAMTIVDVGLVYGVTIDDARAHVSITMTSAACPVTDLILEEVEAELARVVAPQRQVEVELVWEPPWTTDRMSERAKAFMGW